VSQCDHSHEYHTCELSKHNVDTTAMIITSVSQWKSYGDTPFMIITPVSKRKLYSDTTAMLSHLWVSENIMWLPQSCYHICEPATLPCHVCDITAISNWCHGWHNTVWCGHDHYKIKLKLLGHTSGIPLHIVRSLWDCCESYDIMYFIIQAHSFTQQTHYVVTTLL